MCNVVFSFDLMKKCENDRILVTPCPGCISKSIHWSVIIHPYTDKAHIGGVQHRVLDQIDEKLSKLQTCKFIKFDKILVNIRLSCPGCIS